MVITIRSQWGAQPWHGSIPRVSFSQRTEFFVHYDGGTPIVISGASVPRRIEKIHLGNGWAGIGYNFVVDQLGNVFEGRGWNLTGAHCPGHNITGFGVQVAIGGDQEPSPQALAACRALYDEACRLTGRRLAMKGHRDGYSTECPGKILYAWVRAGMPSPTIDPVISTTRESIMYVIAATDSASRWVWTGAELRAVDLATIGTLERQGIPRILLPMNQIHALFA